MCSTIKEEESIIRGKFKWCPGLDLNQHASQRYHLKVVCLPFHHLGTEYGKGRRLS